MIQFSLLANRGIDIETMIQLSFKHSDDILKRLANGESLFDILTMNQKGDFFIILKVLTQYTSFQNAIACAVDIRKSTKERLYTFLKDISYPMFLFFFAYLLVLFFSNSIFPSIQMYDQQSTSQIAITLLKILYTLAVVFVIGFALWNYIFSNQLHRWTLPILKNIYSFQFSNIFQVLTKAGVSTMDCVQVICEYTKNRYMTSMASHIHSHLKKGCTLEEAIVSNPYFDDLYKKLFVYGIQSSSLNDMLLLYQDLSSNHIKLWLHRLSIGVQIFVYVCIGFLVILFYQVMLLPLNMLNTF